MAKKKTEPNKEALQELLRFVADHPELAAQIVIKINPSKILQGTDKTKQK